MIDLRSDTVTRPTDAMRAAMAAAEVGDDVFGDDPTVNALQDQVAELLDFDAGLFAASGTQANLLALLTHCGRGEEYLVGQTAHTYRYEAGGAAALGGIVPQPVEMKPDGTMDLDLLFSYIKPDDPHFAPARLLALENTKDGRPLPADYVREAQKRARERGLSLHLDGARLWNAAVADGVPPAAIAAGFDSVSVCLSKGLGAPVGSVLVGTADFIDRARRWRKMVGGGMRQAGVIAAGGIHAIDHHIDRLADDHANAERLADGLAPLDGLTVLGHATNMVFVGLDDIAPDRLGAALADRGIRILPNPVTRLVTNLDVTADDIETVIAVTSEVIAS